MICSTCIHKVTETGGQAHHSPWPECMLGMFLSTLAPRISLPLRQQYDTRFRRDDYLPATNYDMTKPEGKIALMAECNMHTMKGLRVGQCLGIFLSDGSFAFLRERLIQPAGWRSSHNCY
jgi:hypothetical protein